MPLSVYVNSKSTPYFFHALVFLLLRKLRIKRGRGHQTADNKKTHARRVSEIVVVVIQDGADSLDFIVQFPNTLQESFLL
jgi:hypothetical protein